MLTERLVKSRPKRSVRAKAYLVKAIKAVGVVTKALVLSCLFKCLGERELV